mmetsp:Transcript_19268/g.73791  ORF Transcript_19268/g.73791 Transcript_19268/m.73791 type:complete len:205 (+) Transcript_19268:820-1434(+)
MLIAEPDGSCGVRCASVLASVTSLWPLCGAPRRDPPPAARSSSRRRSGWWPCKCCWRGGERPSEGEGSLDPWDAGAGAIVAGLSERATWPPARPGCCWIVGGMPGRRAEGGAGGAPAGSRRIPSATLTASSEALSCAMGRAANTVTRATSRWPRGRPADVFISTVSRTCSWPPERGWMTEAVTPGGPDTTRNCCRAGMATRIGA